MKISLLYNGKYKILDNDYNIEHIISDTQYFIIDNSTVLKGKTCTLVESDKLKSDNSALLGLHAELSYDSIDVPISDETIIKTEIPFNSLEKIFSSYPLVKQFFGFNYFVEIQLGIEGISLYINSLYIKTKEGIIEFEYDESNGSIEKYFKKFNIGTDVDNVLGSNNHIILKNGRWYVDKYIPSKFDYVYYNLCDIETLYTLTAKQYVRFSLIKFLNIYIYDKSDYNNIGCMKYDRYDDSLTDDDLLYNMSCDNMDSILEACIYFPQLIELEKNVCEKLLAIRIELVTKHMTYNLDIMEEETSNTSLCLFKILNKLLQM
jgi:hypothetical protein